MWFDRAGSDRPTLAAEIAWRAAMPLVARSALPAALEVLERATIDGSDAREEAILLAWRSYVRRALGDAAGSDDDAVSSLASAEMTADDLTLAAGRTMCGLAAVSQGKPSSAQEHWRAALAHAERLGDVLWIVRVRTFRATQYVSMDRHNDALAEIDVILDLAEATGLKDVRAQALVLRATVRYIRGALDEATVDLRRAIELYDALGSALGIGPALTAGPWRTLGDVLRTRGSVVAARDAYERSVAAAEEGASVVSRAMCLAALARCIADDDPAEAAKHIDAATTSDAGASSAYVRVASSAVALAAGDVSGAKVHAQDAADIAAREGDRAGSAWAAEALAAAEADPGTKRRTLEEALTIWRAIGAPVEAGRACVALASLLPPAEAHAMAASALEVLRRGGAARLAEDAAMLVRAIDLAERPPVHIRTLGGFSVLRYGVEVPVSDWQSRKARDLVKRLVVRRGSAVTRDALVDALWPDDDPSKTANRLSVALSTVRGVMDPEKQFPADHFMRADQSSVALDLDHVSVDIERFLADAAEGLRALDDQPADAALLLMSAEASYTGDFLEEDAYEDWAVTLREHARTTYVEVAHALAHRAALEGDDGSAIRYSLRVLERDPFDERAHLQVVGSLERAGHHGEARRCYRAYCDRMDEISIESAPFPPGAPVTAPA